ncbi:hypothetical protein AGMMS50256_01140 [Betaproteobacteria bacterium]|nr:hypothetical protein AGMMS50256_01140 [Betaproteobacteria bacterium]
MDTPKRIMAILGGIISPNCPQQAWVEAANGLSYPSRIMAGIMMLPIAATVAADEPDIAAKKAEVMIVATASPPVM